MRNDDLAAEVARMEDPPLERMVRAGEMDLAHPMGCWSSSPGWRRAAAGDP
jgi:hypothetical protein